MRCPTFAIVSVVVMLSGLNMAQADIFTVELPDFERLYGGFTGNTFQETTYEFGTAFSLVTSATLHLDGFTDISGSTITFDVELDGVTTPPVQLFVTGDPLFPPYSIDIPLSFDFNVLDGSGPISININTSGPGADLSTTVESASLTFEAVPVPEPVAATLILIGGLSSMLAPRKPRY